MSVNNIFHNDTGDYKLSPLKTYTRYGQAFMARMSDIKKEDVKDAFVAKVKASDWVDPEVLIYQKKDNLDTGLDKIHLSTYIDSFGKDSNNEVLTPTFTTYTKKHESMQKGFILLNLAARKIEKKAAQQAELAGKMALYKLKNASQNAYKTMNNSLSGAYSSPGTVFTNRTGHNTLTSMTRTVSSMGNIISESMISGNRIYMDPETILNHINAIVTDIDYNLTKGVLDRFKLVEPSVEETMAIIRRSSDKYFLGDALGLVETFLTRCDGVERAAICYQNDMYHVKELNKVWMKETILRATSKIHHNVDYLDIMENANEWIENFARICCIQELEGVTLSYKEMEGTPLLATLGSIVYNASKVFEELREFIKCFFLTSLPPIDGVRVKEMVRECIVLSDTDSTCATYDEWAHFVHPQKDAEFERLGSAGFIITIVAESLAHYIRLFSKVMNVEPENGSILQMKSEFIFRVFTLSAKTKTYSANIIFQEGNVFKEPKTEIKGVHLKSSTVNPKYLKLSHDFMFRFNSLVRSGETIIIEDLLKEAIEIEDKVMSEIMSGKVETFRSDKVKPEDGYAKSGMESPYQHKIMWEEVFNEAYPVNLTTPYQCCSMSFTTDTKARTEKFLANMENREISAKLEAFLKKHGKKAFTTLKVPMEAVSNYGAPKDLMTILDTTKVIQSALRPLYILLEGIGVFRFKDKTLRETFL